MTKKTLTTLLGDYPMTEPLKSGKVVSDLLSLEYADYPTVHRGFKPAVRELAFDVFEIAIVTFLMAKAEGVPITLLPTLVMGRYQHPYLLYNAERGELKPRDLEGKRVAMRAWTVTTVTWIRGLLANDYGVDLEKIQWFTQEDAHVPGFKDPEGVTRLPADIDITELLLNGDVEAAVIPGPNPDPRLKPIFGDPDAEAAAWASKHDALHVNHYVAVKTALAKAEPEIVAEVTRMLTESKQMAGLPKPGTPDTNLIGIEDNRRSLEIMIDNCYQQGLIPERYSVDSLFDPNT